MKKTKCKRCGKAAMVITHAVNTWVERRCQNCGYKTFKPAITKTLKPQINDKAKG